MEADLVQAGQMVFGLDQEGLVDPGVVHVVGSCRQKGQENIQWREVMSDLQEAEDLA